MRDAKEAGLAIIPSLAIGSKVRKALIGQAIDSLGHGGLVTVEDVEAEIEMRGALRRKAAAEAVVDMIEDAVGRSAAISP